MLRKSHFHVSHVFEAGQASCAPLVGGPALTAPGRARVRVLVRLTQGGPAAELLQAGPCRSSSPGHRRGLSMREPFSHLRDGRTSTHPDSIGTPAGRLQSRGERRESPQIKGTHLCQESVTW